MGPEKNPNLYQPLTDEEFRKAVEKGVEEAKEELTRELDASKLKAKRNGSTQDLSIIGD